MEGMQDSTTAIEKRYTLTTAVCLIVSICIGSGIFFKSDNILIATNGNVALGIVVFLLAATTIVFGGLTLARFAARSRGHGGLISYAREFLGPRRSALIGWHYTFLYMPVVCAVICWVVGVYTCMVFDLPSTLPVQSGIGLAFLVLCTAWNVLWPRLSGYFQNLSTLAKAAPLLAVGIVGIAFARPADYLSQGIGQAPSAGLGWSGYFQNLSTLAKAAPLLAVGIVGIAFARPADYLSQGIGQAPSAGLGWIAAAAPIAFAFDGWSSAVSIAPELKDAQRNLPRALVIGPAVILVLYLAYFVGISCFLGPQEVMRAGDASLSEVFVKLFGPGAATIPNVIALVAVLGTANGMVLATLRMPFSLALHGQMPCASRIARVNPTLKFPLASACMALACSVFWLAVHTVVTAAGLLPNGDISEIGVSLTLFVLCLFYVRALSQARAEGSARSLVSPAIALVSSVAIGVAGLSDPTRWPFAAAYAALLACSVGASRRSTASS